MDTIRNECQKIGRYENKNLNQLLPDAVNKGYEIAGDVFDIKLGHLNKKAVQAIVNDPWTDKSFSDRVWQNKANLIDRLNNDLTTGLATGKSPYKIASKLSESLNVSKNASQRLVITEYMNKLNMGQQKVYEESGYKEVRWHAVEDERKCSICGKLHDTKFKINEAPHAPIHPRCRCILLPVIDEVEESNESSVTISAKTLKPIKESYDEKATKEVMELVTPDNVERIVDVLKTYDHSNQTSHDYPYSRLMLKLAKGKGFDVLPTIQKLDDSIDDSQLMYRRTDHLNELLYGDLTYSGRDNSKAGVGIYFSNKVSKTENHPGKLGRYGLKKGAKILNGLYLNEIYRQMMVNDYSNDKGIDRRYYLYPTKKDYACFYDIIALYLGYDGYFDSLKNNYVILNRGALIYYEDNENT